MKDARKSDKTPVLMKILRWFSWVFLLTLMLMFSGMGCGPAFQTPPFSKTVYPQDSLPDLNDTSPLIQKIEAINNAIVTNKGVGWITLKDQSQSNRFRMAWAVEKPDKIRVSLLSAGHPVETVVADGKQVRLISHTGRHPVHTINDANPSLAKVLTIPVTVQDIITIFSGKVPLRPFDKAERVDITYGVLHESPPEKNPDEQVNPSAQGDLQNDVPTGRQKETARRIVTDRMLLLKRGRDVVEKIVLGASGSVISYSLFDSESEGGEIKGSEYTVLHQKVKRFDEFLIPVEIRFSDRDGRFVFVEIVKYFPNAPVKASTFDLTGR